MSEESESKSNSIFEPAKSVSDFSTDSTSFFCKFCLKGFPKKHGLNRHVKVCSLNESSKNLVVAECEICGRPFNRMDNLKKHMKNCAVSFTKNKQMKKRGCLYDDCKANFYQKEALIQHLTNNHGHSFQERNLLSFTSYNEFETWKEKMEEETHSYFIKINGKKGAVQYFYCQQDGEPDKTERKTNRRVARGQIKTGKTCIAYIKLTEKPADNCYDVVFQPMHCHLLQPRDKRQHQISKKSESAVNSDSPKRVKKSAKVRASNQTRNSPVDVPNNSVLPFDEPEDVFRLGSLKVLKNSNDEAFVINMVQNYLHEDGNPIILHKSSSSEVYIGPKEFQECSFSADTFVLGIQTKEQKEMLASGSEVLLSLDTSHVNKENGYQILNLIVPDENFHEYPVGHLITNDLNASVITVFLYSIISNCGDLTISCILSNNDAELNEAIHSVFGQNGQHIFCLWSLYKDFVSHLQMYAPSELQNEMFYALDGIIHAGTNDDSQVMLQSFKETYAATAPDFVEYLWKNYAGVMEKWIMSCRDFDRANVNTCMFSEANHNKLLSCMNRKPEWNLEEFVNLLLELEEDDYLRRANEQILGVSFGLSDPGNSRHERGLEILDSFVSYLFKNHWEVIAGEKANGCYLVVRIHDECQAELCYNACPSNQCRDLCGHLYYCTCTDKNPMCKHIHKVHSTLTQTVENLESADVEETESIMSTEQLELIPEIELEIVPSEEKCGVEEEKSDKNLKVSEIKDYLARLSHVLSEGDSSMALLKHLDRTLRELITLGGTSSEKKGS